MGRYDLRRASEPLSVVVEPTQFGAAWRAFEAQRGPRYLRVGSRLYGSLYAPDGSQAAGITRRSGRARQSWRRGVVSIAGRVAYETRERGGFRPTTLVTDANTGQPILTITPDRQERHARCQFRFANARVLTFPLDEGTERGLGISRSRRRLAVMRAVDGSGGTVFIARGVPVEVVLCVDATPESLLVALLGTAGYFLTVD
jgi:hypothetical protein